MYQKFKEMKKKSYPQFCHNYFHFQGTWQVFIQYISFFKISSLLFTLFMFSVMPIIWKLTSKDLPLNFLYFLIFFYLWLYSDFWEIPLTWSSDHSTWDFFYWKFLVCHSFILSLFYGWNFSFYLKILIRTL